MANHKKELRRLKQLAKHQDKISSVNLVKTLNETPRKNETPKKNEQNGSIFSFLTNLVGFASPKANQKETKADQQEMPPQKEKKSALFAQDKQAGKDEQNESIFSFIKNLVSSVTGDASTKADKKVTPKENRNVKKGLFSSLKPVGILGTIGVALWAMVKNENIGAAVTSHIVSQCINELTTFASVLINKLSELGQSLSKFTGIEFNWKSWEKATQLQVQEVANSTSEISENFQNVASCIYDVANIKLNPNEVEGPSSTVTQDANNTQTLRSN